MKIKSMETKGTATAWIIGWFSAVISQITSLSISEWSGIVAIVGTLMGLYLTWYYKRKEDKRSEQESLIKKTYYEKRIKNRNKRNL